jgi:hypothetical protein
VKFQLVLPVMSHPQTQTAKYTLKPLKLFLSDDKRGFERNFRIVYNEYVIESLNELEQAATEAILREIKNIAHK